ncbi:uncharacterized protein RCO7_01466 [Rhynchosporium graminicola]|uniref:Uncharacterized protein n=1 Tax=Rhynchosporium graminicola TaxID=2792576 RepID=A0A1E1JZT6_9HELO|nr:uncharacterized protein RCO7_01466 [Rhynchosporium commune]
MGISPQTSVFKAMGEPNEISLEVMKSSFSSGLDVLTRTIFTSSTEFTDPLSFPEYTTLGTCHFYTTNTTPIQQRNKLRANKIRKVCQNHGWLAGWYALSQQAPECGLHEQFINDVRTCVEVYSRIRVSTNKKSALDVSITVKSSPNTDSMHEIGPKGLGGKAWLVDPDYMEIRDRWSSSGYAPMGPPTVFGWNAMNKKSMDTQDEGSCRAMQMLGTVDYDLDLDGAHDIGFAHSLEEASKNVLKRGSRIQGGAVAALLNSDLQRFVRSVQMEWVEEGAGSYIIGPEDVSVDDWVKTNAIDCAAIMGFGYQDSSRHTISLKGVFVGNLLANMHDSLYDMGCSSRMSTVMYARGSGVKGHKIHQATAAVAIACFDNIAGRINQMTDSDTLYYGDCMGIIAFSWSAFNGRYRTWERFVKYSRQLKRSNSAEAGEILGLARKCPVLKEETSDANIATAWEEALEPGSSEKLTERNCYAYTPPPGIEILNTKGVSQPDICKPCNILFIDAINTTDDAVRGIEGLPQSVSSCRALGLAAAIHRAAVFAASDTCCDVCACRIGNWGDSVAYRVLVALMKSEEKASAREWLLQNYIVGCVDFWPISVPSVLAGFDMVGDLKYDNGAMGIRDVVDC